MIVRCVYSSRPKDSSGEVGQAELNFEVTIFL